MKLRKYKKKKISNYISINIIIILFGISFSLIIISYFSKKSEKILLPLSKIKIEKSISFVINHATENVDFENDLYQIDSENNEIKMINYNTKSVINMLDKLTFNIEEELREIENGKSKFPEFKDGFYGEIPFGVIFDNPMMANIGPKIKLKFLFLGSVVSNIETEVKPYGINNAYIEMRVNLTVNGRIVLPFVSEEIAISNVIPIQINIIEGKVPEAYLSTYK